MTSSAHAARHDARRSPDEIRAYLARLLGTAAFQASPRRRKLLAHVVERTLAGQGDRLKAFDLALSALGRDERFDPQNDPIVRIEVGRLRRDLEHYYLAAGGDDPIRITIPKGHYVPAFEVRDRDAAPEPKAAAPLAWRSGWRRLLGWRAAVAAGLCVVPLLVALALWAPWRTDDEAQAVGPALVVVPFQALSGGEGGQLLASGLTNGLITDLMRFDALRVFAAAPDGDGGAPLPAAAGAPAYVVTGAVERGVKRVRVTARLTDRASGEVVWSQRYDRALTAADVLDVEDELVAGIAGWLTRW